MRLVTRVCETCNQPQAAAELDKEERFTLLTFSSQSLEAGAVSSGFDLYGDGWNLRKHLVQTSALGLI